MANRYEVECISKDDRDSRVERITHIGGSNSDGTRWRVSSDEAIRNIEAGVWSFFVRGKTRQDNVIVQRSASGRKYLKTDGDRVDDNNLLYLDECP